MIYDVEVTQERKINSRIVSETNLRIKYPKAKKESGEKSPEISYTNA